MTAGRRRRWIWIGGGAVLAVLIAAVAIVALVARGGSGPSGQFERAAKSFHDQYGPVSTQVSASLRQAGGGIGDSRFLEAQQAARQLSDAFDTYGKALKAIAFPERAKTAADDLTKATEAGKILMVNAAGFFSKDQMQATLDQYRPQVEKSIREDETALRAALK